MNNMKVFLAGYYLVVNIIWILITFFIQEMSIMKFLTITSAYYFMFFMTITYNDIDIRNIYFTSRRNILGHLLFQLLIILLIIFPISYKYTQNIILNIIVLKIINWKIITLISYYILIIAAVIFINYSLDKKQIGILKEYFNTIPELAMIPVKRESKIMLKILLIIILLLVLTSIIFKRVLFAELCLPVIVGYIFGLHYSINLYPFIVKYFNENTIDVKKNAI